MSVARIFSPGEGQKLFAAVAEVPPDYATAFVPLAGALFTNILGKMCDYCDWFTGPR